MDFLPVLRKLVLTYQAFEQYSSAHTKSLGLTMTQFDLIATLGNQPPMTCKLLGEKTLREINQEDGRSQLISLTKRGQQIFDKSFPEHMAHLQKSFGKLTKRELDELSNSLEKLQKIFK